MDGAVCLAWFVGLCTLEVQQPSEGSTRHMPSLWRAPTMCPLLQNVVHQRVEAQCARLCSGSLATGSIIPAVPQKFPLQQRRSVQVTTTCLSASSTLNNIQTRSP